MKACSGKKPGGKKPMHNAGMQMRERGWEGEQMKLEQAVQGQFKLASEPNKRVVYLCTDSRVMLVSKRAGQLLYRTE